MAGAYKGLTIRIGADSTKLSSALRSANSAIYKTQSELNKLTKAMKLDPGNQNAASLQMGKLSEQTTNVAKQIDNLKKGIGALATETAKHYRGIEIVDGESIAELSEKTKSVTLQAEEWKRVYTDAGGELDKLYDKLNKIAGLEGEDAFSNKNGNTSMKELNKEVESLIANHKMSREEGEEYLATLGNLKAKWNEARVEMDNYANAAKLDSLNADLALQESKIKDVARQFAEMASKSNISKSTQDLTNRTELVGKAADDAAQRFRRLDEAAKLNPNSIGTAADRAKALGEAMHATHEKATALKAQIDAYRADGIDRIAASTKDSALRFQEAKENVARLKAELEMEIAKNGEASEKAKELGRALEGALKELDTASAVHEYQELETQMREVQATSKSMGGALAADLGEISTAAVTAAVEIGNLLGQAGSKIVEASSEIDSAYRDMRKTVNGTEEQYQDLYDAAIKYSQTHVTSADQMLEMEAIAGQVGIAAESLQGFAETAADLDVATDIDAEAIALQMGQITNVMSDLDEDNVRKFADALVRLGNNMPAQESAIMNIAQRMSSVANITSMSTPDVLAWSAAIASTGARSEMASTAISNTMMGIESAVAAGGDDLKAFAEIAGVSAKEFADQWENNPTDALKGFIEGLKNLEDSDESAIAALEKMGISGVRQKTTLLALTSTLDKLDDALEMSGNAWNGVGDDWGDAGDAAREAEKKAEGFSGSLAKMKNSAQVLASTLGEALAPYIDMAAELLQRLSDFINNLDSDTKTAAVGVGTFAAAFATGYPIISAILSPLGRLAGAFRNVGVQAAGFLGSGVTNIGTTLSIGFQDMFLNAAIGVEGLATSFTTLATSGALIPGIFGAIAAATAIDFAGRMLDSAKRTKEFKDAIEDFGSSTDDLHRDLLFGKDAVSDYGDSYKDAMDDYNEFVDSLREHARNISETRDEATESIADLENYKRIIDDAAGAGKNFAGDYAELDMAIDGVNEAFDLSITRADVLKGKYEDEEGVVHNLKDSIDDLIASKEKEIQLDAMKDIYKEAYKAEKEAVIEQAKAQKAYMDEIDKYVEEHRGDTTRDTYTGEIRALTDQELESIARGTDKVMDLAEAWSNSNEAVEETKEQLKLVKDEYEGIATLDESGFASSTAMGAREGMMRTSGDLQQVRDELGMTGDEFAAFAKIVAQRMQDCGITTSDFANVSMPKLAEAMRNTGGDVQGTLDYLVQWAQTEFPDKYANIYVDENGDFRSKVDDARVIWDDASESFKPLELDADTTLLEMHTEEVKAAMENEAQVDITVDGETGEFTNDVEQAKNEAEADPAEVTATADTEQLQADLEEGAQAAAESASDNATVEATVEMDTTNADTADVAEILGLDGSSVNVAVNITANAEGASEALEALDDLPENKTIVVNIKAARIASTAKNISTLNTAASKMVSTTRTYKANGNATTKTPYSNIKSLNSAASSMKSKSATYTANGNAANGSAASHVWDLVSATRNMYSKSVTLTTNRVTREKTVKSAAGTYIDPNRMPKHAAGIFTRPTLTNIGWVGEDGAELYSGNSLVPLTNRKYSMPYINDISDAVARKLDFGGGEKSITLYVSCEGGPNETASAIVRALEHADI